MSERLHVDSNGRLQGPANITYNSPWPCVNGQWGFHEPARGVVMHTEAGFEAGTISVFNNPSFQASAFFSIGQDGHIHQYGPVGKGWVAWTQADGNLSWIGIEDEDRTQPGIPLTDAQLTSFAQVLEACSAHAGFRLQATEDVGGEGLGWHGMGGAAWGGHLDCPGDVRRAQRPDIIRRAQAIRSGSPAPAPHPVTVTSNGTLTLAKLAAGRHSAPATTLRKTAEASPGGEFVPVLASYVNQVLAADTTLMPDGMIWHYQQKDAGGHWQNLSWETGHARHPEDPQTLNSLAVHLGTDAESVLRLTAEKNPGGVFTPAEYAYINGVFARGAAKVPNDVVLHV
jgi:N-acetylmuramoyl-L-alanine amidase